MAVDPIDIIRKVPIARDAMAEAERIQRQVKGHESLPAALYVAEVFLFIIIAVYFAKLAVLSMGIVSDYGDHVASVVTYVVDVIMLIATVDAVLGISSRKPSSWRKVMRGAILLFVFSVIGSIAGTGMSASALVTFSPVVVAVMCIPILGIMMTRTVRDHYVPPLQEMPGIGRWIAFAFFGQLFPARRYEIDYS